MSKKHRYYILNKKTKASADTPLRPPTGEEECIQLTLCAQDINHFEFCCHHKGNCRHDRKEQELPVLTRSTKQWEKFDCFIHWFDFQKIIDIGNIASIFKFQSAVIRDVSYLKK